MENLNWWQRESLRILVLALPFIFLLIFWSDFPERVPIHWNHRGEADNYGSKYSLIGLAVINVGMFALFWILPHLDPQKKNYLFFQRKWHIMQLIIHVFMTFIFVLIALVSLGFNFRMELVVKYGVITLFLLLGNYMGNLRRNYFIGIRTPWTLASDYVWNKTHRFTASLWVLGSVIMLIYSFWEDKYQWVFFVYIGVLAVVPVVYSYLIFRNKPAGEKAPLKEK